MGGSQQPLKLQALDVGAQAQQLLFLTHLLFLECLLVGFLLHPPLLWTQTHDSSYFDYSPFPSALVTSLRATGCVHLALLLDSLLPGSPLLTALLLVTGLRGDAREVRVVDLRHSLRLPGSEAPAGQHIQWDTRLTGHADGLGLSCAEGEGTQGR